MPRVLPLAVASAVALALAPAAHAASPDVVISQVYGGGGNAGATYTNDYVQLTNTSGASVSLTGWKVEYASASGTSYQSTPLTGSIGAGATYLVGEAAGMGGSTPLPSPAVTGTIAMSATSGKVRLTAPAGVRDFVGYGTANEFEGSGAAPALNNTTADKRSGPDTDDNKADFAAGDPAPGTSVIVPPDPGTPATIEQVQGSGLRSPLENRKVLGVTGVVTQVAGNEFWMQDPVGDGDPATSDGVAVFTGTAPTVAVGDAVSVDGKVQEFLPGNDPASLTITEIASPVVTVTGHGKKVTPTLVGTNGRVPAPSLIAPDGIAFWESLEGMRIAETRPIVVGPTNSFDEAVIAPKDSGTRTARGGLLLQPDDANPERIVLDDAPTVNVFDRLVGSVTGVVGYAFDNYTLTPDTTPGVTDGGLQPETAKKAGTGALAVATFNVENLSPADPQLKFDRLAAAIVNNLQAPDLVALEEIQDNTGPTDDGTVDASATLQKLVTAISAAGGPTYQWREIDPVNDADGGQPGGNIRQAFLFRTDRGLQFVDRPGGGSTTPDTVTAGQLAQSPGRIAPADTAWNASRKPLVGEFVWKAKHFYVIANHFDSKGGDDPLFGARQPPQQPSAVQRHQQATLVRQFADQLPGPVIVLGDLNDFEFSQTADILTAGGGLVDLPRTLPLKQRYTYVYEGNSQVLDHILLSPSITDYAYDIVHINSEFANQVSDHDPQVVRIHF